MILAELPPVNAAPVNISAKESEPSGEHVGSGGSMASNLAPGLLRGHVGRRAYAPSSAQ